MKTPNFWNNKNIISYSLYPLSLLYYFGYKARCFINHKPYKSDIKVIGIGNLLVGGSGKTPVAIEIAKILKENGKTFCFLSKGYGGNFDGVYKLYKNSSAEEFGDEPLILLNYGDVFVSKNRVDGLKFINNNFNYDYIIMDDGLQNPTFIKDKVILVIDGNFCFGNEFIFPAGPLRDKINKDIYNLVIINGEDKHNLKKYFNDTIISKTNIINDIDKTKEYIAFCGLGRPEKFKNTLIDNNIKIKDFIVFEDHHKYTKKDIKKLKSYNCDLITTEKDWVKIKDNDIKVLKISIELDKEKIKEVLL